MRVPGGWSDQGARRCQDIVALVNFQKWSPTGFNSLYRGTVQKHGIYDTVSWQGIVAGHSDVMS